MKYRVDKMLPLALEAINVVSVSKEIEGEVIENRFVVQGKIASEYKGYISSLGANIVLAGIRAALMFYQAEETGSKKDRRLVNAAIKYIILKYDQSTANVDGSDFDLVSLLPQDADECEQMAFKILDAATALKLAIRTYQMEEANA